MRLADIPEDMVAALHKQSRSTPAPPLELTPGHPGWSQVRRPILWKYRAWLGKWPWRVRSFASAHLAGFVRGAELRSRTKTCSSCEHRQADDTGERCKLFVKRGCCPTSKRWLFSKLTWLRRLRGFGCPDERW